MPLDLTARELRAIREALNHAEAGGAWLDEIRVEEGPEEFELIKNSIESAHGKIVDEISRRHLLSEHVRGPCPRTGGWHTCDCPSDCRMP